jgi:signal transduction histidine kinase
MLHEFLSKYEKDILAMTAEKSVQLAGVRPTSEQLRKGLPIFYRQLLGVLRRQQAATPEADIDRIRMAQAAANNDEQAMAAAAGRFDEVDVAKSAGRHGAELHRLGYTLSHVVHAYGAMCQSITELATEKEFPISTREFHDLNQCLDVAIAGAVTEFQSIRDTQDTRREVEHLGFLAHELRNALTSASVSFELIQAGKVGMGGSTGGVVRTSLKRLKDLIDRSLTEVRLRVDPKTYPETVNLLQLVDQIAITAEVEARSRNQVLELQIDPALTLEADQHLFFSALSNLIQNALKYTRAGGRVVVRGGSSGDQVLIDVEDECGGLSSGMEDLFKPYVQQHQNREGLGLGLTIARRAVALNHGTIELNNHPGKGCTFRVTLPRKIGQGTLKTGSAA